MIEIFITQLCRSSQLNVAFLSLPQTGESRSPVEFEAVGDMGERLDSLRATLDERLHRDNGSSSAQHQSLRRRKRFLSYPRYVELMVTADAKMVRHHGRNLEHYILTIMSVVSKIMFLKITFLKS